jgi:hypothetical protein
MQWNVSVIFQPLSALLAPENIKQDQAEQGKEDHQGQRLGVLELGKPHQPFHFAYSF